MAAQGLDFEPKSAPKEVSDSPWWADYYSDARKARDRMQFA
jgi:hypothetical protein